MILPYFAIFCLWSENSSQILRFVNFRIFRSTESPQVQCCTAEGERQAFRLGGCHGQAEGEIWIGRPVEHGKSAVVKDDEKMVSTKKQKKYEEMKGIRAMTSASRIEQNERSSDKFSGSRASLICSLPVFHQSFWCHQASEVAQDVSSQCIDWLGGVGFTKELLGTWKVSVRLSSMSSDPM